MRDGIESGLAIIDAIFNRGGKTTISPILHVVSSCDDLAGKIRQDLHSSELWRSPNKDLRRDFCAKGSVRLAGMANSGYMELP